MSDNIRLVHGSTDRVKLDWRGGYTTGPDGRRYMIQSEHVRGEGKMHYAVVIGGGCGPSHNIEYGPYGQEATMRDQKKACEYDAWVRAGRPVA